MKKLYQIILLLIAAVITVYIVYITYPSTNPLGAIKLNYNAGNIERKAKLLLKDQNFDEERNEKTVALQANKTLLHFVYKKFSFSDANEILREKIPGYYWEIEWGKMEGGVVINDGNKQKKNAHNSLSVNYDTRGNLISVVKEINDSLRAEVITEDSARQIARNFIRKYSPVNLENPSMNLSGYKVSGKFKENQVQKIQKISRTEYRFEWETRSSLLQRKLTVSALISGNLISEYNLKFDVPEYDGDHSSTFDMITTLPFYIIIYILIIMIGYKRIRAYELSFRLAMIMGITVGFLFSVNLYTLISDSATGWELWLPLIFSALFFALGVLITWSVSETLAREAWKEKFISLDLLTKGYVFHSRVGSAGIGGLTGGFIIYLIWTGILIIAEHFENVWFMLGDNSSSTAHFQSVSPALTLLDKSIYPQIYATAVFLLFIFSGLRRRFNSLYVLIPVTAVIWGVMNFHTLYPLYWGIPAGIIISALFLLFFYYYDVLASLIALSLYYLIDTGVSLFTAGNSYYQNSGIYLIAVLTAVVILLIIALYTKDKTNDFDSITPAFVKNITERQRLQRELEIAKDVQMSFLPARAPEFKGLDIAAECIPANEVGGDYFDFVNIDQNKFGVIIGDVSGKGTQAAFYMTLAKGFVKALSKTVTSPSEFLIKINELFYENVERGTFISMIYGIFDIDEGTLTFSRAGHNPVIAKQSSKSNLELLNPQGLALGLEKGTIFNKTIKETRIKVDSGDTFIFYTDGFTEARNKYKLEYTEERLMESISSHIDDPAKALLEKTLSDIKIFIGKTLQHDDMTMVVVKVK